MDSSTHRCPLCGDTTEPCHEDQRRKYRQCPTCALISVPTPYQLDATAEKRYYELHENDPGDAGYRRFLSRAAEAVRTRVTPPAHGLDFGSGPGPTLSLMLEEAGYTMSIYDKYFAARPLALQETYDFVTATEVFEHLARPATIIRRLLSCLRPGGWLIVMTKRARDRAAFAQWHYTHDPTHIAFYGDATFHWIAERFGLELDIVGADVVALRQP